ncbi:MAG: hypothetical protein ACK4N5_15105, partial [Myxococcales bacterium]
MAGLQRGHANRLTQRKAGPTRRLWRRAAVLLVGAQPALVPAHPDLSASRIDADLVAERTGLEVLGAVPWDEAFADASAIFRERLRAVKLPMVVDTTDAGGLARFTGLKPGQYWIHARYDQPYTELYWNLPVTVERGEP